MDEMRKRACRYLLYRAMLDIRPLAWNPVRLVRLFTPFLRRREIARIRRAGDVAHWLHNLAAFSAHDFDGFDEQWFWREHGRFAGYSVYKRVFEQVLAGHTGPPYGSELLMITTDIPASANV